MKGIILAGGHGTRLHPVTLGISKQLIPVYDKPMIYYAISVLMLAEINEILIITTPEDQANFQRALGNGKQYGISLSYAIQEEPNGLAEAFIIGKDFIGQDSVALALGDNIFYGDSFGRRLLEAKERATQQGLASNFLYKVKKPSAFGVMELNEQEEPLSIEEKPEKPKSNWAVTGLYFYDNSVIEVAQNISPSERGELEITAINEHYLKRKKLYAHKLGRGFAWLDTGTHANLMRASQFIQTIEERQGFKVACLEEIAYNKGWLSKEELLQKLQSLGASSYKDYLEELISESEC